MDRRPAGGSHDRNGLHLLPDHRGRDIRPQAPTHVLVMPKVHIGSLAESVDERLAGRLLFVAAEIARKEKLENGWRLIVNTGAHGGQEVPHLHLHVVGGKKLGRMLPQTS